MKTKIYLASAFLALTFFISCTSNDKETTTTPTAITTDEVAVDSKIDAAIDDVANIAEDQFTVQQGVTAKSNNTYKTILPLCAVVKASLTDGVWTNTINFGTEGCTLANGNILKGKIIISFSNDFSTLTQTITYRFDGFLHNGKLLQGTKTIIRTLKSTALLATIHPVFDLSVDLSITFENGKVYAKKGNRVREMIEGFDTKLNWEDNVFAVTGSGTTTHPNGDKITAVIKNPVRFAMACKLPFPIKGSILLTKNNKEALLDFGNGDCDNLATLAVDGQTIEIKLGK